MHTIYINDLINYSVFWHVFNIQMFILRKTCICNFVVFLACIHISSLVDVRMSHPDIDQTADMDACKKYHTTACTILPEDEHLDVRNLSKTL